MPVRPLRPCRHRGCAALASGGRTHCVQHAHEQVKWKPDAQRGNRHARGYGSVWIRRRVRILCRDCGLCQVCRRAGRVTPGTEVDHVVPKSQGGSDEDDNLQTICRACHQTKTGSERR
ncbi:HNH endonuclease [Paraburkholderia bonniea]|nr:HNH endonuclease [Paraburkholderia bonniea]WJF92176.1 HNH endonuclease [Paraburkholderia bonniea]WJF95496.1 HNH endonuclease [Paraburkholderia bonniea]